MQHHLKVSYLLLFVLLVALPFGKLPSAAYAQTATADSYKHISVEDISVAEKAGNFGVMYLIQWGAYYATQKEIIENHGSMENWKKNMTNPRFDRDHFNFNLSKHTATGHYYYLFYRSRGYGKQSSFHWAAISSFAFEFTIENLTERPSYQDMYQTPVFGSIVGMGLETLSLYFHSLQTVPTTMLGYLFNPFTILPFSKYQLSLTPTRNQDKAGIALNLGVEL